MNRTDAWVLMGAAAVLPVGWALYVIWGNRQNKDTREAAGCLLFWVGWVPAAIAWQWAGPVLRPEQPLPRGEEITSLPVEHNDGVPEPYGEVPGRFTIMKVELPTSRGLLRIDTATGRTWALSSVAVEYNGDPTGATSDVWLEMMENADLKRNQEKAVKR